MRISHLDTEGIYVTIEIVKGLEQYIPKILDVCKDVIKDRALSEAISSPSLSRHVGIVKFMHIKGNDNTKIAIFKNKEYEKTYAVIPIGVNLSQELLGMLYNHELKIEEGKN